MQCGELANYNAARQALAQAHGIDEVRTIKDKARAVELYAIEAKDREMELWAVEIRTRAERKAGELLAEMGRNGERATKENGRPKSVPDREHLVTLPELAISRKQSHEWQKLAKISEPEFEKRVRNVVQRRQKKSTAEALRKDHQQRVVVDSSASVEWRTPAEIVALVIETLGEVDLDPCAESEHQNVPAHRHFIEVDDGLAQSWKSDRVFMNPPYGNVIAKWAAKFRQSYESGEMAEGLALIPARTETQWFREFAAMPVCFLHKRLNFSDAENGAPFPSAVIYAGRNLARFAQVFGTCGTVYVPFETIQWNT